jgi:acetyl esterase/lipase
MSLRRLISALSLAVLATSLPTCPGATAQSAAAPSPMPPETHHATIPPTGYASIETLWPGHAPGGVGTSSEDIPKLYCYPASGPGAHAAVVVLPGGGYINLVMEKEGAAEARWLNAGGVSAYILEYRLAPRYHYPVPMLDGLRAVRFVRAHAAAWHLHPDAIGVWGFSAGGHLAGYLATADPHANPPLPSLSNTGVPFYHDAIDDLSAHPDFAVISYGRLSLDPAIPGSPGMKPLLGDHPSQAAIDAIDPVRHVTAQTSPSFIYATEHDAKVNSLNATAYFSALQRDNVPAELHIFEFGPHGTGLGQHIRNAPELDIWPLLLQHWMQAHGWISSTASPSVESTP